MSHLLHTMLATTNAFAINTMILFLLLDAELLMPYAIAADAVNNKICSISNSNLQFWCCTALIRIVPRECLSIKISKPYYYLNFIIV